MGKGEIVRYEQFLLFPQCFQNACFQGVSKGVVVWEWVKGFLKYRLHRKHCGKRWNSCFEKFHLFLQCFPKVFFFNVSKCVYMEERFRPLLTICSLIGLMGKNASKQHFSPFLIMSFTLLEAKQLSIRCTHSDSHAFKLKKSLFSVYANIYYSKFAKDHFFLVKYFCILRKLHKQFCVS